jgi:RHS repeat-associated protein
VQIENGGFVSVAAGGNHSLAVDASGNVWAWGQGGNGELGNGGTANSNVPIELTTLTGMTTVAAGYNTSFAFAAAPLLVYNPLSALARFFFPVGYTPDPVNTASGDGVHTHTDISIPGRGIPLQFTRYYHSGSTQARSLGVGWTHTYDMYLSISPAEVTVFYPDGHAVLFPLSNGTFVAPPGVTDTLVQNANGTYTLTTAHQVRYIFSSSGVLTAIADRDNNTTTLAYTNGLLTAVTDPGGRSLTFTYDGSNRIVTITDPLPAPNTRTVRFGYDANGDLTTVTDVKGGVTTYAYSNHQMTSLTDANGHLAVQNVYDSNGRVAEQHNALGGVTCTYYGHGPTYTSAACPGVTPAPTGNQTIVVDPRGNKTTYTTDARGRTVAVQDALGDVTQYAYDANDNTVCVTDPRGNKTGYAYDGTGNLVETIDALNTDGNCNLKSGGVAATFTYTPLNDIAQATDLLGRLTVYSYDASGNLVQVAHKDASGSTVSLTCFARNSAGEVTAKIESTTLTDCTGNTTSYTYDTYGNQTSVTDPRFVGQPNPPQQIFTYDLAGRMLTATNELGHATTYTYDPQNNVLTITDNLAHTTTKTYDAKGNLTSVTDANNHTTRYAYDDGDHLTQVTDPLNQITHYGYDLNGNRTSVTDANNHTTSYAYDALNRLQVETDPLNRQTTYQYDAASHLSQRTDARGLVTKYSYDAENRLVQVQHWNGSTPLDSVSYTYDAVGNRLTLQDPTGTTSYVYDALNRPTSMTFPGNKVVAYQYDAVGNRTGITYPDNKQVTYTYDPANDLQSVTDWLNKQTVYRYDDAGKLSEIQLPNGITTTYGYDNADRLIQIVHRAGSTEISSYTYTLDPSGNRTQVIDPSGTISYQYDALDRLTQAIYPGNATTSYTYDPVGNRTTLTVNGTPTSYSYDNADELTQVGSTAYGYDANGNQTSRGGDTFTYDPENRLTQSVIGGQTSESVYNGDGLRVSHTVGGATTNYTWDVAAGLPDVLQDGTNTYVYGIGLISATDGSGNQTYFLHDGLGSTVALTDGSGNVTATYAYDAFGAVRSQTGGATNPWQFTGQQLDADSSLYFLRARYYDPSTGRFLGRDPLSASLNPYSYADNNPVNATDPSGMVATSGDPPYNPNFTLAYGGSSGNKEGGMAHAENDCLRWTGAGYSIDVRCIAWRTSGETVTIVWISGQPRVLVSFFATSDQAGGEGDSSEDGQLHHIATDKSIKSGWTARFSALFERAGMSLQDKANKVFVVGHKGKHSVEYHEYVYDYLRNAVRGAADQAEYASALRQALGELRDQIQNNPGMLKGVGL